MGSASFSHAEMARFQTRSRIDLQRASRIVFQCGAAVECLCLLVVYWSCWLFLHLVSGSCMLLWVFVFFSLVFGFWCWFLVFGFWFLVFGFWFLVFGFFLMLGFRFLVVFFVGSCWCCFFLFFGSCLILVVAVGFRFLVLSGSWFLVLGSCWIWVLVFGFWILPVLGSCRLQVHCFYLLLVSGLLVLACRYCLFLRFQVAEGKVIKFNCGRKHAMQTGPWKNITRDLVVPVMLSELSWNVCSAFRPQVLNVRWACGSAAMQSKLDSSNVRAAVQKHFRHVQLEHWDELRPCSGKISTTATYVYFECTKD